ncbi:MAG: SDR family oxidoreductase [Proteobacteria bacterium]|nr:SDR family oxidoreductase [Pseudomonadota bacterium]
MNNSNVIVYGATGGIGLAISRELVARGAQVYLIGRSLAKMKRLVKEIKIKSSQTFCISSITSEANHSKTLEWLKGHNRRFSVGIHCAGLGIMKKASTISLDEWREVVDINLNSAFAFFHLIWELRSSERCELVYFGSASVDNVWPKNALYGASKVGLEMFAKALQKEIRPEGGRVWLYKPGSVRTGFYDRIKNHLPPDKMIPPEDLAGIVIDNLQTDLRFHYPEIPILSD